VYQEALKKNGLENFYFKVIEELAKDGKIAVKLDIKSGFSHLFREYGLRAMQKTFPDAYPYILWHYGEAIKIFTRDGSFERLLEEGFKQGGPLVPLIFCTAIHVLILYLKNTGLLDSDSDTTSTYTMLMDDLCIVGTPELVHEIVKCCTEGQGKDVLQQMGLQIHPDKIHVYWPLYMPPGEGEEKEIWNYLREKCAGGLHMSSDGIECVGIPAGAGNYVQEKLREVAENHQKRLDALRQVPSQIVRMRLLRECLGAKAINHLLRCLPPSTTERLTRNIWEQVLNFVADMAKETRRSYDCSTNAHLSTCENWRNGNPQSQRPGRTCISGSDICPSPHPL
jgi:hypothetical protein